MPRSFVAVALVLCAILLPISIALSNIALGLVSVAVIIRLRRDGDRVVAAWRREPLMSALLLYAAAGLVAALLSGAPAESQRDAIKDLHRLWPLGITVAALALDPETPVGPALGISFGAMALYGIGQTAFGGRPEGVLVRAHGFVHPVVYGEMMALAVLGGASALLRPRSRRARAAAAAFTIAAFAALILSGTRMALGGVLAGVALMALLEPRARRWVLPALMAGAAAVAAWEFAPIGYRERALSSVLKPGNIDGTSTRRILWDVALKIFRDHPLTGAGPGGYRRLFPLYHPEAIDRQTSWASAHNLYLHQLAERGVLGGAVLFVLCALMIARPVRAARRGGGTSALWTAGAVAAFLVMSLTETSFQNEQFGALLMLIWAWGTAILRAPDAVLSPRHGADD
ncbi:MAG: O-antigen ligase family protein [Elusimicrobiota bacterium]